MSTSVRAPLGELPISADPPRLRAGSLNFLETIGQSIANIAPTLTPALNITVVAGLAGIGSWVSYLVATVGMMFVAANIGVLAKKHPMAGSYFVYIGRSLGPFAGMMAGWAMICAYAVTAMAVVFGFSIFLSDELDALGLAAYAPPLWLVYTAFVALVWAAAYRDIRLSSRIGLILEGVSIGIIALITIIVMMHKGTVVDHVQLDVANLPYGGVMSALTFAVFSFVGFESAATLAKEARNPTRVIPAVVILSAGIAGIFFIAITYFMVLGVDDQAKVLGDSSSPFAEITSRAGLTWAAAVVYFAAMISSFACGLACINAVSRLMFSMGRYRFIPNHMGRVHERHQTPHLAIAAACVLTLLVCLLMVNIAPVDAFGYTGTFATFGFLVIYALICIVAPLELKREGAMKPQHLIVGVIGVLLMAFVIFGSVYPVPPAPYNLLPYLFLGFMVLGALWFAVLASRSKGGLAAIQHDLET